MGVHNHWKGSGPTKCAECARDLQRRGSQGLPTAGEVFGDGDVGDVVFPDYEGFSETLARMRAEGALPEVMGAGGYPLSIVVGTPEQVRAAVAARDAEIAEEVEERRVERVEVTAELEETTKGYLVAAREGLFSLDSYVDPAEAYLIEKNADGVWTQYFDFDSEAAARYFSQVNGSGVVAAGLVTDMAPVNRAHAVSMVAHGGQRDKLGVPYSLHPEGVYTLLVVSEEFAALDDDEKEDASCAAYLHDVVEDTSVTLDDLRGMGFSEGALAAVDAISMREGESKDAYYARVVAAGPVARALKLADLGHNNLACRRAMLPGAPGVPLRADDPKGGDMFTRLGRKYAKAYRALGAEVPEHLLPFAG